MCRASTGFECDAGRNAARFGLCRFTLLHILAAPPPSRDSSFARSQSILFRFPLLLLALLLLQWIAPAAQAEEPASLDGRWSYRWDDPPRASGPDAWDLNGANWQPTSSPINPENRQGQEILWLKLDVPQGQWRDPHLFVSAIDINAQVFDGSGRRLYQYGEIDDSGRGRFAGWPWHLIAVPHESLGQSLYFRVFSDYDDIGLAGTIMLGERADLMQQWVYGRGFTGVVFAAFVFVVGVICLCLGLAKRDRSMTMATALLSFDLTLMMFAENELNQLVAFTPLLWRQIAAYTYFLVPGLVAWVMLASFRSPPPRSACGVLIASLSYTAGVMLLSAAGVVSFVSAYPVFDALLIVLMTILLVEGVRRLRPATPEGYFTVGGLLAIFVSLLVDMASAHNVIPWAGRTAQWGLSIFALSTLGVYTLRVRRQKQQLLHLQHSLEDKVAERTRELEESQQQLLQLAHEDHLTGLLNRRAFMNQAMQVVAHAMRHREPVALALFDVDHFKTINDLDGHAIGDEVLRAIGDVVRNSSRTSDLACRYGGEEFVVLMPRTSAEAAQASVERLRSAIAGIRVDGREGRRLTVSVSIGLIVLGEPAHQMQDPERMLDQLLSQADAAMYRIKKSGRNGVNLTHGLWSADTGAWEATRRAAR